MNLLTHKLTLWYLGKIMDLSFFLDSHMVSVAKRIAAYEKPRFMVDKNN